MIMVTYDFYRDVFLGCELEEEEFPKAAARAERWMQKIERTCYVAPVGADSRDLAVCAAAEVMEQHRRQEGVAQTAVGGVSVRYDKKSLERKLLTCAGVFLDIRRGVSG